MKKFKFIIAGFMIMMMLTSCSLIINTQIEKDGNGPKGGAVQTAEIVVETEKPVNNDSYNEPFWGVWCYGAKDEISAYDMAKALAEKGFESKVFITTDWGNLNKEKFYVVSSGVYKTEEEAKSALNVVIKAGYKDAYVKYSGEYIK